MSATTFPTGARPLDAAGRDTRPTQAKLVGVELRKMVDTRAGMWLLIATAALTVLIVGVVCITGDDFDRTWARLIEAATLPTSVLLPIIGILLVTSEWSQRTALVTFALVPQRGRVLTAKLLAGILLAIAAFALCLAVAAVASAVSSTSAPGQWSLSLGLLGQIAVNVVQGMIMGIGFGALFLASAPGIVFYFVLPIGWSIIGEINAITGVAEWLDGSKSLDPLTDHLMSPTEWARAGTTLLVWVVLPVVLGWWRIRREELK
jgi:ABC-type transport system involved in multi-copper enzyme maturation permease subunit